MLVKKDPSFLQSYLEDSSNLKGGYADCVVIPESVRELASVLKEANSGKTPVTISGAGTGQAGGGYLSAGLFYLSKNYARSGRSKSSKRAEG